MPMRGIWCRPTQRTFPEIRRSIRNAHRGAKKNPTTEEKATHSRNHGLGGNWGENETVLSALGTLCTSLVWTSKKIQISQEEAIKACKYTDHTSGKSTKSRWSDDNIRDGKGTEKYWRQREISPYPQFPAIQENSRGSRWGACQNTNHSKRK